MTASWTTPEKFLLLAGGFVMVGFLELGLIALLGRWFRWRDERRRERFALVDRERVGL